MIRSALALIVSFGVVAPVLAAEPAKPMTMSEMMQAASKALVDAFNKHDIDAFMALYSKSPDVTEVGPDGSVTKGWDGIKANTMKMWQDMKNSKMSITDQTGWDLGPGVGQGTCHWAIEFTGPDGKTAKLGGTALDTVKKDADGQWRVIGDAMLVPMMMGGDKKDAPKK